MTIGLKSSQSLPDDVRTGGPGSSTSGQKQRLPETWIERLFERLTAFYGSRFADMWRGCDLQVVKRVWAEELAGYRGEELAAGLQACRALEWPPTLPAFMRLCRPAPDYERAFEEAVEQMRRREAGEDRWSSAAIYWAAARLGADLWAHPYQSIKGRWKAALDDAIEAVRAGKLPAEVPTRRGALPAPGQCAVSPEVARQRLAEIRQRLAENMRGVSG